MPAEDTYLIQGRKVWITCHSGLVGSAILRRLWRERCEIVLADSSQLDLRRQDRVEAWLRRQRPDVVFLTDEVQPSGAVGAEAPATFLHQRRKTTINIPAAARASGVSTLVDLTASRLPSLMGANLADISVRARTLHPVYGLARLAPIRLTRLDVGERGWRFLVLLSSCVFGSDRAACRSTPLLAALFLSLREAAHRGTQQVEVEGGDVLPYGLIHADDLADAAVFMVKHYRGKTPVDCRQGDNTTLCGVAELAADVVGYSGRIVLRPRTANASEEPVASIDMASLGWHPNVSLRDRLCEFHETLLHSGPVPI